MKKNYLKIIGLALLIFVLWRIDLKSVFVVLQNARWAYLILATLLALAVVFFKTWRWKYLLAMQSIKHNFWPLFKIYLAGCFLGTVTPGKVGELGKVFYLKKDKEIKISSSLASVIIDRLLDFFILSVISLIGLIYLSIKYDLVIQWKIGFLIIILLFILVLIRPIRNKMLALFVSLPLIRKYKALIKEKYADFCQTVKYFKKAKLLIALLISLLATGILFLGCFMIVKALNIDFPFFYLIICVSIANLISLIPITISGIGTRDAILILLFSLINYTQELAIAFSTLFLFIFPIFIAVLGALIFIKNRRPIHKDQNPLTPTISDGNKFCKIL